MPKRPFPPRPEPCLTCPAPEFFEIAVLGGAIHAAAEQIYANAGGIEASIEHLRKIDPEKMERHLRVGVARGMREAQAMYANSRAKSEQLLGEAVKLQ
jgi:hypothetical protein